MTGPSLPQQFSARAHDLVYGGEGAFAPVAARDAATVCLLRDTAEGPEVLLMRRSPRLAFAPGMYVFPGGAIDPGDAGIDVVADYDWDLLGRRASSASPRALLAAAVRETFEEAGVLLAFDAQGAVVSADARFESDRITVMEGRWDLNELLALRGLRLDPTAVPLFAHWVTPEVEDRRFDTRFFVARMPDGQVAGELGGEADRSEWWRPADALAAKRAGELELLPPTVASLHWLAAQPAAEAALAAAAVAVVRPVMPRPLSNGTGGIRWALVDHRTGEELGPHGTSVTAAQDDEVMAAFATDGPDGSESAGVVAPRSETSRSGTSRSGT